jgi:hypothetical protein
MKKETSIKKLKSTRAHSINLQLATWDQDKKKKYFLKYNLEKRIEFK